MVETINKELNESMCIKNFKISGKKASKTQDKSFETLEKGNVYNVPINVSNGRTSYAKNEELLVSMPFFEKSDFTQF
jgi:hypothetical protein